MKKQIQLFLLLMSFQVFVNAQINTTDYDEVLTETKIELQKVTTNYEKPFYQEITKQGNLVFTNVINNLPQEAITYTQKFATRTNYITGIYKLGKTNFPKVNKIFAKYNVPAEVNVLLALESYFNKNVISKAKAVGYWQFINATAIEYGLNISDSLKDERRDLTKSTTAAAKYLKAHYNMLGDWYLTVASYNCGIGNVKKAITKSGKYKPTFFEIKTYLPKETQNYVMNYIALNLILKNYNNYLQNKIIWEPTTQKILISPSNKTIAKLEESK